MPSAGGRTWWAHFKFTSINIELTIHKNQFEERRIPGAFFSDQWFESPRTVN
jgi:hypothetical protein